MKHQSSRLSFIILTTLFYQFFCLNAFAQKQKADSLRKSLYYTLDNKKRIELLRLLSFSMYKYSPDSALNIAYEGLRLAKNINFIEGISNSYEVIAIVLTRTGNYDTALSYYIKNLKIEETLKSAKGIASANNNIGIVYAYLKDYNNALKYYKSADQLCQENNINYLKHTLKLNIGDAYEKLNNIDSSKYYYQQSLTEAYKSKENYNIGFSMIGLGNVHYYLKNFDSALLNYRLAKEYMLEANDEDLLCEINLGMARVFQSVQMKDSASFYAKEALFLSQKDNFLSRELNASVFLASMYSNQKKMDSAYYYLSKANILKDTLLGEEKTRFSEQIKFNENIRQQQQIEEAILQKETRRQQLQLILIALFIPLLFILTILLSRRRIKTSLIKFLGIISLLFFFEFITLLLHPLVEELTHHTPFLEILIFVAIAGIIIPTHHRIEHWLIELLIKRSISKERNRQI